MLTIITDYNTWISFLTLTFMEIVLGVDNIMFISLITQKLPVNRAKLARQLGLLLALILRIMMLLTIGWIMSLNKPIIDTAVLKFSWHDIILAAGGIFLIYKATKELYEVVTHQIQHNTKINTNYSIGLIIAEIAVIDLVFSFDSIITAIGLADHIEVMIAAIIVAIIFMYFASEPTAKFLNRHPTAKILALCFLLLIGFVLLVDGFGMHIPRGYVYFAIIFSVGVQFLNEYRMAAKK